MFGNAADFLGLGFGRHDLAILKQVRHQTAEQRFAMTGRATQFALVCQPWDYFLLSRASSDSNRRAIG